MRRAPWTRRQVRGGAVRLAETPEQIPGLKAWFDARTDDWFTFSSGSAISAWVSRAGSLGSISFAQATASNQPTRATSVSSLGNKNAVLFDGTDDRLQSDQAAGFWAFMHNGDPYTIFSVRRIDSTGSATQYDFATLTTASQVGMNQIYHSTNQGQVVIGNGSGTYVNANAHVNQGTRDVSAWQALTYVDGSRSLHVSGLTSTNADSAQANSSSDPAFTLYFGSAGAAAGSTFKGYLAQRLIYDRVLTSAEIAQLATWANKQFGVAT